MGAAVLAIGGGAAVFGMRTAPRRGVLNAPAAAQPAKPTPKKEAKKDAKKEIK